MLQNGYKYQHKVSFTRVVFKYVIVQVMLLTCRISINELLQVYDEMMSMNFLSDGTYIS